MNLSGKNADTNTITQVAQAVSLPLETIAINEPKVRETYERDFVLVRPDGHVAWRGDAIPESAAALIDKLRGATSQEEFAC